MKHGIIKTAKFINFNEYVEQYIE